MDELIALDFETFYSPEYSLGLAKYNTSEYIRDSQFLIHGVGIQPYGRKAYWITGHDEALRECQRLDLEERPVVAHNMAFDGFILHEHADIHCGQYCDTLSMARAAMGHHVKHNLDNVATLLGLGAKTDGLVATKGLRRLSPELLRKLAQYCINDTILCMQVFEKLCPFIPDNEMKLIDLTLRMFCEPKLLVDEALVLSEYETERVNKRMAVAKADTQTEVLMSNNKFADLLRSLGVEPPLKISPRTGKQTYAFAKTDAGFAGLLAHVDESVRLAAQARVQIKSTLAETRAKRLYAAGRNGKALPVLLNYAGAHTFRWSGGNKLNLQNLPRGGALRRSIRAPRNCQIVVRDLSQIEARLTAWLSGQRDILAAFAAFDRGIGEDVYRLMASKIYGKNVALITDTERFIGKICVLAMGFGMGWKKLQLTLAMGFMGAPLEISEHEARHIIRTYRFNNTVIVRFWDYLTNMLARMAVIKDLDMPYGPLRFKYRMIELPNGLALKYPGLQVEDTGASYISRYGRTRIWGGMLLENIVQALARCVIAEQILEISKDFFVATMTHDEVVCIVPDEKLEYANQILDLIMTTPPDWAPELPLAVEGGHDVRYSK